MIRLIKATVEKNGKKIIREGDLTLKEGEIVEVFGRNGSGKTTLLKVLALMQRLSFGRIIYFGKDITNSRDAILSRIRLHYIGYVEQQYRLIPGTSVVESVSLPLLLKGVKRKEAERIALAILPRLNLAGKEYESVENLSAGERQRVSIASALAKDPKVLILDEPFSSQDEGSETSIKEVLEGLKGKGKMVVFSSPYLVKGIADKAYFINEGSLVERSI